MQRTHLQRFGFGVSGLVFGVEGLGVGVWCLVFGVWCLVFGVWCLVFGVEGSTVLDQPSCLDRPEIGEAWGVGVRVWV